MTTREDSRIPATTINLRIENFWREEAEADCYRLTMIEEEEWYERCQIPRCKKKNTGKRPGGSNTHVRPKYWNSAWGKILRKFDLQITGSNLQKVFMRRFWVPYRTFLNIVQWTKRWHEKNRDNASGRPRCPTELKVIGWIRIVDRIA